MGDGITPPGAAITFLKQLGADHVDHKASRSLLDHLMATFSLLSEWRQGEAVALAGLMHSIYGTTAFEHACVAPDRRDDVTAVIGPAAERLAYLFSAMERDRFLNALDGGYITDRFAGIEVAISAREKAAICEILFANELDLAIVKKGIDRPDKIEKKVAPVYDLIGAYLSPEAHAAYARAIGGQASR